MGGGATNIVGVPTSIAAFVGRCGTGPLDTPVRIGRWADYEASFGGLDGGELGYAVRAFYLNGGGEAWVVRTEDAPGDEARRTGIYALEAVDLFNLLCLPDLRLIDAAAYLDSATRAAAYCRGRLAFLILDLPATTATVAAAESWMETVAPALGSPNIGYAAAYWPEPMVPDGLEGDAPRAVGPSGMVAGVYATTDAQRGVWKAPAGIEAALAEVIELSVLLTDAENGILNPLGLNVLRTFPVYGSVVWGARTLAGADLLASDWKYVPVRRLALFIEQSLARGLKWTVFEPNAEPLWSAVRLQADSFMSDLFRQGAFMGASPQDAYSIQCDATTTTPTDIEAGIVNLIVAFAPVEPAEFILLQIQLQAAASG